MTTAGGCRARTYVHAAYPMGMRDVYLTHDQILRDDRKLFWQSECLRVAIVFYIGKYEYGSMSLWCENDQVSSTPELE